MRISYRASAAALLIALTILIAIGLLAPSSPRQAAVSPTTKPGTVYFDPCFMWRQVPWNERLAGLVWLGSLIALKLYGLGNRRARLAGSINLVTLVLNIYYKHAWASSSCYSTRDVVLWSIWFAALALVCLQHIFVAPSIRN